MELTLCIIAKDEEENLKISLSAFRSIAKDIIVVDTGSVDGSVAVAKRFGAGVLHFDWVSDFSAARNFALEKVTTGWIMMIDADDTIDPESLEKLKQVLGKDDVYGFFMPYIYAKNLNGKGVTAYLPRIWRAERGYRYILPVHEYLNVPKNDTQHFIKLNIPIIHRKSSEDYKRSMSRNIDILEKAVSDGCSHRILFYLGHDNQQAGNTEESIYWYEKFLGSKNIHAHEAYKALMGIGHAHLKMSRRHLAKGYFLKAIEAEKNFIEPYLVLGDMCRDEANYPKAMEFYKKAKICILPVTHVFINSRLYDGVADERIKQILSKK